MLMLKEFCVWAIYCPQIHQGRAGQDRTGRVAIDTWSCTKQMVVDSSFMCDMEAVQQYSGGQTSFSGYLYRACSSMAEIAVKHKTNTGYVCNQFQTELKESHIGILYQHLLFSIILGWRPSIEYLEEVTWCKYQIRCIGLMGTDVGSPSLWFCHRVIQTINGL